MTGGNDTGRVAGADSGPVSRRRQGEASETETGDGVLAWMVLRQVVEYGEAWRRHAASAGTSAALEPGPFPIRIQTEADLEADRFEMLAWEDPEKADGPASPFWRQDGMPEGLLEPGAEPLVGLVADRGSVEGQARSRAGSRRISGARRMWRPCGIPTAGCARRCGAGFRRRRRLPTAAGASWCRASRSRSDRA